MSEKCPYCKQDLPGWSMPIVLSPDIIEAVGDYKVIYEDADEPTLIAYYTDTEDAD